MTERFCAVIGGMWLVSVEELQRQLDAREDAKSARLAQLRADSERPSSSLSAGSGPHVGWVNL